MEQEPASDVLNEEVIMDRVGGDVEFLQELAGIFVEDCPKLMTDIRTAISASDAHALEHAAHTLKGSVANFGAEPAREAAFRLEILGRSGDLGPAPEACTHLEQEISRFTGALTALSQRLGSQ